MTARSRTPPVEQVRERANPFFYGFSFRRGQPETIVVYRGKEAETVTVHSIQFTFHISSRR